MAWTRGSSSATRRAVNALETSRRSRVWSGGSARSIVRIIDSRSVVGSRCMSRGSAASRTSLLSRGSVRAARPSSYRVTSQASSSPWTTARRTGPSWRSSR